MPVEDLRRPLLVRLTSPMGLLQTVHRLEACAGVRRALLCAMDPLAVLVVAAGVLASEATTAFATVVNADLVRCAGVAVAGIVSVTEPGVAGASSSMATEAATGLPCLREV